MQDTAARVLSCETMAQDLVRIILSAPDIAAQAKAGQFIHILVPDSGHVLRRPISLMAADAAAGTLTLAIQPKGAGTQTLCACKPGRRSACSGRWARALTEKARNASTLSAAAWALRRSAARWMRSRRRRAARSSASARRRMLTA
ncbi:MAG: hypothetical protein ACLVB5_05850 [Christensenellales bacterium]